MSKDFRFEGRFIFSKKPMGFGVILELNPPYLSFPVFWVLKVDLLFIRFWIENRSTKANY